jgi:hypothetical protein
MSDDLDELMPRYTPPVETAKPVEIAKLKAEVKYLETWCVILLSALVVIGIWWGISVAKNRTSPPRERGTASSAIQVVPYRGGGR